MAKPISYLEEALSTPEALKAFVVGIMVLVVTRNFEAGWNAMIEAGRRNGALAMVETAAVKDLLRWVSDKLEGK